MRSAEIRADARRAMEVCNACRYCEGFCAVFPAMELRRTFSDGELDYLANLCHNCRGCYYACQYAPPHEFGINLPRTFAELRGETYAENVWPRPLARLFARNGLVVSLAAALGIALVLLLAMALQPADVLYGAHQGPGAFYAVIPYGTMVAVAGATFGFAVLAMVLGVARFWRRAGAGGLPRVRPLVRALGDVLTLRYLGGGGDGCNDRDEAFSQKRRWLHQSLFYGFLLCLASTTVAAAYDHFLGLPAPYPFWSWPVLLGTVGGIGMVVGTSGLFGLKLVGDRAPAAPRLLGADVALIVLLGMTAVTGLLLLGLRATGAMGVLLAIHLGFVLAVFLTMPYSKFVHGGFRVAALLRYAMERDTSGA
ncbi:MAG TPA: tricarballylate utilization 4Fe-4S protein TcuB [bacterium]|nr:tricarballylate utilization 4Fe-4S protein TcuB [bacterium]